MLVSIPDLFLAVFLTYRQRLKLREAGNPKTLKIVILGATAL